MVNGQESYSAAGEMPSFGERFIARGQEFIGLLVGRKPNQNLRLRAYDAARTAVIRLQNRRVYTPPTKAEVAAHYPTYYKILSPKGIK